ncbi:MAG TPA: PHP domain-containing protein, partial [Chitinophagaceae bacterium]|nr:PHP domain-containing protein [Chitinophagaceae bacterium]
MALPCLVLQAQDSAKKKILLPDIPGYKTLRCDFHMHTVFSDGHVWPTFRVHEAVRDGLDAISLTEHIDFEGQPEDIKRNYNRAYELAAAAAKNKDLLIIRGAEI